MKTRPRLAGSVQQRGMMVAGLGFVLAMSVVFLATGADRGPVYVALQAFAAASGVLALAGAIRSQPGLVAAGFGGMALGRLLHMVLDLSRLPAWLQVGLLLGYGAGAAYAAWWTLRPAHAEPAVRGFRAAAWALMALHFAGSVIALSGGRLPGIVGLALGCVGFSLVAPNVEASRVLAPPQAGGSGSRE